MSSHRLLTHVVIWLSVCIAGATWAQNPFEPVARVNESIITAFEVEQRVRFLQVVNAPGATPQAALEELINDRLRIQGSRQIGLELTEEGLTEGLEEFAGRADLTLQEFIDGLAGVDVDQETLRDFVAVQLAWRDLIRVRFGNRVQVSETDVDRAIEASGQTSGLRVLLSEVILPARSNQIDEAEALAQEIAQARSFDEFSDYARAYSATRSAQVGGRLDWVPLNNLPAQLRPLILGLAPGEVTEPLPIPDAIALFQLRDIEETGAPTQRIAAVEYAAYYIDGGRSPEALARANRIATQADVCDDLFGIAQGEPPQVLERGSLPPSEIPDDIALELAKLDTGEISTNITRAGGQTLVLLMLCGRTPEVEEDIDRAAVRVQLENQRFGAFADTLLEELRAEATIEVFAR